jgi:cell division septation protein DedD
MADNTFRSFRRDTRDAGSSQRDTVSDPLAELARLIGQSDGRGGFRKDAGWDAEPYDETAPAALDWGTAGEDYARHGQTDEGYAPPRFGESHQHQPVGDVSWFRDQNYEDESNDGHYSRPAAGSDEPRPGRTAPVPYVPPAHGGHFADAAESADHGGEEIDEQAVPRRSGTVVVVAVLGLAVLGTAGALGYHAMFGGSVIPSLPPIIKPGDTPIKIVPKHESQAGAASQADADAKSAGDQLVTHEEQPVSLQAANPVPRVVTTIPVVSNAPDAPLPGAEPPQGPGPSDAASPPPAAPPLGFSESGNPALQFGAATPAPPAEPAPAPSPPETKTVRTVTILPQQRPAAAPADASPAPAPDTRPVRAHEAAVRPPREPAQRTASAGPLSILPGQEGTAPSPRARTRTAMTNASGPMALNSPNAAPETGGGYAVQVTAQRSEADAMAAFRSLQARYPQQLGGRRAFVRRADLGAKGVYYRALIGPFASADQAANLCSSLKAAGGSCLIQRN